MLVLNHSEVFENRVSSGYLNPAYAESMSEYGMPLELPASGGSILVRDIPGYGDQDAMGCYPLFTCENWHGLQNDLNALKKRDLVSFVAVVEPFGDYDEKYLLDCFKDKVMPFKAHFLVDTSKAFAKLASKHHRYYARKALENVEVDVCLQPVQFLDDWVNLFDDLIKRHQITGVKKFSKKSFLIQLGIPGMVVFRAFSNKQLVAAHLWYIQKNVAYSHLAASSQLGYELMASYALYKFAIDYFADKVAWMDLGAGAGLSSNSKDGLTRFKKGWSSDVRMTYLCGRIYNYERYRALTKLTQPNSTNYFPAYRAGELS